MNIETSPNFFAFVLQYLICSELRAICKRNGYSLFGHKKDAIEEMVDLFTIDVLTQKEWCSAARRAGKNVQTKSGALFYFKQIYNDVTDKIFSKAPTGDILANNVSEKSATASSISSAVTPSKKMDSTDDDSYCSDQSGASTPRSGRYLLTESEPEKHREELKTKPRASSPVKGRSVPKQDFFADVNEILQDYRDPDRSATKPVDPDRSATKPVDPDRSATKPVDPDRTATKPVDPDRTATKPADPAPRRSQRLQRPKNTAVFPPVPTVYCPFNSTIKFDLPNPNKIFSTSPTTVTVPDTASAPAANATSANATSANAPVANATSANATSANAPVASATSANATSANAPVASATSARRRAIPEVRIYRGGKLVVSDQSGELEIPPLTNSRSYFSEYFAANLAT